MKILMKLHVSGGHASAKQLERALARSEGVNAHSITCVEDAAGQCELCQAFDKAPHAPVAGTSTVALFNEELQVDLLFLDDITALHILEVHFRYSFLLPVRANNLPEVWDSLCSPWIGGFGPPKCIQMYGGGERKDKSQTELRSERRFQLPFQGAGARPWVLELRNGFARGICNRLKEDERFPGEQVLPEVQWRLNALISSEGFSAYQIVFRRNPVDL